MNRIQKAAMWAADLFEVRTRAIEEGTATVLDLCPSSRVSWSEVWPRFGLSIFDQEEFKSLYNAELDRRGLSSAEL